MDNNQSVPSVQPTATTSNDGNSQEDTKAPPRRSPRRSSRKKSVNSVPKQVIIEKKRPKRKRKSTEKIEHLRQQEAEREQKIKEAKHRSQKSSKKRKIQKKKPVALVAKTRETFRNNPKVEQKQNDDDSTNNSLDEKDVICCICNCGVDFSEKEAFTGETFCQAGASRKHNEQRSEKNNATSSSCEGEYDEQPSLASKRTATHNAENKPFQSGDNESESDDDSSVPYCGAKLPSQLYDSNNALIICDTPGCNRSFHQRCHFVPVFCLPKGKWNCLICQFKEKIIKGKPSQKKRGKPSQKVREAKNYENKDNEYLTALSTPLTEEEVNSIFPPPRDSHKVSSEKDHNLYLQDNLIVTVQDRFEFQSAPLKASILNTEVKRRIKSTIDSALGTIRLEEHTIRGYTETDRAKKSLKANIERSKRVPQQLVQSVYRLGSSKMKIRDLMHSIDSVVRNKKDKKILLDWFAKAKKGDISISCDKDIQWDVLESKLFSGAALREEPRFDIADYDGDIESDEDDDTDVTKKIKCTICFNGEVHKDNDVLMCDGKNCFRAFHMKCCNPIVTQQMLDSDENGTWFCPYCSALANAIHYTEIEYIGDDMDEDELPGKERKYSWDEADDVFPEAPIEVASAELWKLGCCNDDSDKYLNSLMGIEIINNEGEENESDDESDHNFSIKDDGSISSSSSSCSDDGDRNGVDLQWNIEQNELDALSLCSSTRGSGNGEEVSESNRRTTRHRSNQKKDKKPLDIGKVDQSNIVHNKRRRTQVDYRKLNGDIFGNIDQSGDPGILDDEDDYDVQKGKRKHSESDANSSCSSSQASDGDDESKSSQESDDGSKDIK